jgi:hypothetical protein
MTAGFAVGPLVAGALAQWMPARHVLPYLPHVLFMSLVVPALARTPETVAAVGERRAPALPLGILVDARFAGRVLPLTPWVFTAPAVAFALRPRVGGAGAARLGIALTAGVTGLCAVTGVLAQTLARSLPARLTGGAGPLGLLTMAVGLGVAAATAGAGALWPLVPTAIVLGVAYGLCLVAGLSDVQRLATPATTGGLTAIYYLLAYLGFAVPYTLGVAAHVATYTELLGGLAAIALACAAWVARRPAIAVSA